MYNTHPLFVRLNNLGKYVYTNNEVCDIIHAYKKIFTQASDTEIAVDCINKFKKKKSIWVYGVKKDEKVFDSISRIAFTFVFDDTTEEDKIIITMYVQSKYLE